MNIEMEYMYTHRVSKVIQVMGNPFLCNDYLNVIDNPVVLKILSINLVVFFTLL